ncbi:DUF6283 family protein [Mycobacteroides abscessus]|uniref:DUF6283 family protein n=1 Tax=Mycobacteroides abscessus TaxID=36809 RepID=UPI001F417B07|nr:DUF6283 family protein [Mycobacteroides abscessus]
MATTPHHTHNTPHTNTTTSHRHNLTALRNFNHSHTRHSRFTPIRQNPPRRAQIIEYSTTDKHVAHGRKHHPDHRQRQSRTPATDLQIIAPIFACHKSEPGRDRACAGWLAVVGVEHLGIRLAVTLGRLPARMLRPGADWPDLFGSYEEMADRNTALGR